MANNRCSLALRALIACTAILMLSQTAPSANAADEKDAVFEIRTYTAEPDKLPDLLKRFREHTCKLFEKHGMTNVAYWVPTDEPKSKNTLIYILAHQSRDAAKKSWDGFRSDPEWIKVRDASEANGKIVTKVDSIYATATDFSPKSFPPSPADAKPRVFEIRTYTIEDGKLPECLKLFREPVIDLFKKHDMTGIGYWVPTDEPRSQNTIIYILAHDSRDAAKKGWDGFKADTDWRTAKKSAEANGKVFKKTESVFAAPTDFSPLK
jgi:hypothetical protein